MADEYLNDLTDTWNSLGTVYASIKMNVLDVASAAGSKLIDLQINSVSKFAVDKNGNLVAVGTAAIGGNATIGGTLGVTGALTAASLALTTALPITSGGTGGKTQEEARSGLGLGTAAVAATGDFAAATHGHTAATGSAAGFMSAGDKTKLDGIDLSATAPLNSPALTGNPTAPTPAPGDNDTSIATTAFVQGENASRVARAGDRMTGALSSAVVDHGTKGAVTEAFAYASGNTHKVTVNGALTINPTGLAEGDVMQINVLYQSGSITVSGTTYWELGAGSKSTTFGNLGVSLVANTPYRIIFEMVGGLRMGVFQ